MERSRYESRLAVAALYLDNQGGVMSNDTAASRREQQVQVIQESFAAIRAPMQVIADLCSDFGLPRLAEAYRNLLQAVDDEGEEFLSRLLHEAS